MHRKIIRCFSACIGAILFLSSCAALSKVRPGESESVSADGISGHEEIIHIEKLDLLGNLTFTPDYGAATETVFKKKETTLQVEDSSGLTWKLTIPSNALVDEATITMTPLKDVKGANGGDLSGVLLEPDGLKFIVPATLTVTGNGAGEGWIYCADHKGMDPELALTQQVDGGIECKISHFSSVVVDKSSPLSDPDKKAQIDNSAKKVIAEVKKLLKKKAKLPEPPSIKLECLTDDNFKEANKYRKRLFEEETACLATLSMLYTVYKHANDPMAEEVKPLLEQLSKRAESKITEFFEKYSPDPERFLLAVTLLEDAMITFLGNHLAAIKSEDKDSFEDQIIRLTDLLLDWGKHTMDYIIEQIRTKHNYRLAATACFVNEFLKVFGEDMLDEIRDAYTFKVTFEGSIINDWEGGTETWRSKGEALVQLGDDIYSGENLNLLLSGEGTGQHLDYSTNGKVSINSTRTQDFTFGVKVYPAPCGKKQARVEIDKFGPDELTYVDEKDGSEHVLDSVYKYLWIYFDLIAKHQSAFSVVMDFESGEAEFEDTLETTYETSEVSYDIRLEHCPQ
jgi:hypothetical protein